MLLLTTIARVECLRRISLDVLVQSHLTVRLTEHQKHAVLTPKSASQETTKLRHRPRWYGSARIGEQFLMRS